MWKICWLIAALKSYSRRLQNGPSFEQRGYIVGGELEAAAIGNWGGLTLRRSLRPRDAMLALMKKKPRWARWNVAQIFVHDYRVRQFQGDARMLIYDQHFRSSR
jgi:hypothetical protein